MAESGAGETHEAYRRMGDARLPRLVVERHPDHARTVDADFVEGEGSAEAKDAVGHAQAREIPVMPLADFGLSRRLNAAGATHEPSGLH